MSYEDEIARALGTPGGHLAIGRGGFTLHYENARLSDYDSDTIGRLAMKAGLPVIDSRRVPFAIGARLVVQGPMIAVNRAPDGDPRHAFASAPLAVVAAAYRQAGAAVHNVADCPEALSWFADRAPLPLDWLIDDWLAHVLRAAVVASAGMEELPAQHSHAVGICRSGSPVAPTAAILAEEGRGAGR